jgi:hypothetical protein
VTISVVQSGSGASAFSGSFASNVTAGNTLFLVVAAEATANVTISSSDPEFNGSTSGAWTQLWSVQSGFSGSETIYSSCWMLAGCAGGARTVQVTVTNANTNGNFGLLFYEVAGLGTSPSPDPATPNPATDSNTTGTTATSSATGTTGTAAEFIIGMLGSQNSVTGLPSAPWTSQTIAGNGNASAGYQVSAATGTFTYSHAQNSGVWIGACAAIVPGSAAASAPAAAAGALVRGRSGRKGTTAGSGTPLTRPGDVPPVLAGATVTGRRGRKGTVQGSSLPAVRPAGKLPAAGASVRGRAGRKGSAQGSTPPLTRLEDVPPVPSGRTVTGRRGKTGSAQGSKPVPVAAAVTVTVPAPAAGKSITGRKARKGTTAGSPPPLTRPGRLPASTGASVRGKPGKRGSTAGSGPVPVSAVPYHGVIPGPGTLVRGRPGRKGGSSGSPYPSLLYISPAGPLEGSLLGGTVTTISYAGTITPGSYSGSITPGAGSLYQYVYGSVYTGGGAMALQSDISGADAVIVSNTAYFYLTITYNGEPLNLTGYTPKAYLKATRLTPDTDAEVFTTSSGLTVTSTAGGTITWVVPPAVLATPSTLWYRVDVIDSASEVFTCLYGNFVVQPA